MFGSTYLQGYVFLSLQEQKNSVTCKLLNAATTTKTGKMFCIIVTIFFIHVT